MPKSGISLRELSKRIGYSPAAISYALNDKPGVSPETAEKIKKLAAEMGYCRPGEQAIERIQFVIARQSGHMIDEGSFRPAVIDGIEHESKRRGLGPVSLLTVELNDENTCATQLAPILNDTSSGIVLLATEMSQEHYEYFANCKAPLVVVDGVSDNHFFESIVFSNEGSAYRAVRYLVEHGHTRIGYLAGKLRISNFPLRERGYLRALTESGITPEAAFRVELATDTMYAAYTDMLAWLNTKPELPTAFFADNDAIAVGAMRALAEKGHSIPNDVSFVGFDDVEFASIAQPGLTTVHVPRFDIGRMAAQKVFEQASSNEEYSCVTHISTKLIERESVRTIH